MGSKLGLPKFWHLLPQMGDLAVPVSQKDIVPAPE